MISPLVFCLALSYHTFTDDLNSVHPCVKYDNFSLFLNSENNISLAYYEKFDYEKMWLETGIVSGYQYADVLPFIRAGIEIDEDIDIFLLPVPTYGFVYGIEYKF